MVIIHQTYHIVAIVLLFIALKGTSWKIIEYNTDESKLTRIEYGLWQVCQNSKTGKTCQEINPVSDALMTTRIFMYIAVVTVILHMVYTIAIYVRKYCYKKEKSYTFISINLLIINCLSCSIAVIAKSLDNVNEVLFDSLERKLGFSFGIVIFTCILSFVAIFVSAFLLKRVREEAEARWHYWSDHIQLNILKVNHFTLCTIVRRKSIFCVCS